MKSQDIHQLTHDLLRAWAHQLRKDYLRINHHHLSNQLRPCAIEVTAGLKAWGRWSPHDRRISIRASHVLEYSWSAVLETLKHEMAHQYVDEVLGLTDVQPHGEAWKRTCGLLGIRAQARDDGGVPISHVNATNADSDPILRRARKLLALAQNNPEQAEVEAALSQAQALLLRYNLSPGDLDALASPESAEAFYAAQWLGPPLRRVPRHHYHLASLLERFFFVQAIWVPSYLPQQDATASQLEVCGTSANLEMAAYVYTTILRTLEQSWKAYRSSHARARGQRAKNSYFDGILQGFASQLEGDRRQQRQEGLVWRGDPKLSAFFKRRNPSIRRSSVSSYRDSEVRRDGFATGRNLRLKKPLRRGSTHPKRLTGRTGG